MREFWKDNGFNLSRTAPEAGVMETDWAENRAKLPQDFIRNTIGKVLDSAYSTGELDKFRRASSAPPTGSDIFITHRGMDEVYVGERNGRDRLAAAPGRPAARSRHSCAA